MSEWLAEILLREYISNVLQNVVNIETNVQHIFHFCATCVGI